MYTYIAIMALLVSNDYESMINQLAGERNVASLAHAELTRAGTDAFPALLARIRDETIIDNGLFQGEVMRETSEGKWVLAKPTIGLVAFELIQFQVESAWPKGTRQYHALNRGNVEIWVAKHKGLSISQLKIRAVVDSLDSVTREIEKEGIATHRIEMLAFLRDRLSKVLDEAKKSP